MRKIAVVTTASGSGGTTVGRRLAEVLGVPFHELDALFWKPGWIESTAEELRERVVPIVRTNGWVIDGSYQSKLGQLVLGNADVVVWLDPPMRVWLPRLVARTLRRALSGETLWGTNRETLRGALLSRHSLLFFTLRHYRARRRLYPVRLAGYDVVRLRSRRQIGRLLSDVARRAT